MVKMDTITYAEALLLLSLKADLFIISMISDMNKLSKRPSVPKMTRSPSLTLTLYKSESLGLSWRIVPFFLAWLKLANTFGDEDGLILTNSFAEGSLASYFGVLKQCYYYFVISRG
jgi:hypothetical protein